jgi:hypothetical protein
MEPTMKFRLALALLLVPVAIGAQPKDPVAGAWEQLSSKNLKTGAMATLQTPPVHVIYADGHYVQFAAAAGRTKGTTPRAEMTKEQLVERYNLQGQYGTYRVVGSKLARKTISAALPDNEGTETTWDVRIEGDTLILTNATTENRFRRLK